MTDNRLDLDRFQFRTPDDPAAIDLQVYCNNCENTVTTAEDGDSLDTIARMCDKHVCIHAHEAGCWLDGAQGWHNNYRVVRRAVEYGMELPPEDHALLDRYEDAHETNDEAAGAIIDQGGLADRATEYLNQHAPDGYVFVWEANELSLIPKDDAD